MQLISKPDLEPSRSRTSAAAPSRDIVHGVTFFRGTAFPAARIASFLCSGLETAPQRGAALVFASAAHSAAIRAALQEQAVDVDAELRARRLAFADAESIALALEHGDVQQVFCNEVESTVNEALRAHGRVNVYGEIVDLLVLAGRHEHAMHLERLWHELLQRGAAQLLCGYNFQGFGSARLTTTFQRICGAHSFVEPIEDGSRSRLRPPASARAQSYDGRTFAELDQALAALDTESRAKDEFLAVLGHELRNPLAPILTAVQVMGRRSPQLFTEERGMIERQVRHMVRLVEDLLDVSRIARGKVSLQCAAIEIERVIGDAITTVAPLIEERSHRLRTRAERGLFVLGDTQRLTQVLVNLLSNAAKYTPDGGEIEIDARRRDGHVEVSVRDSGAGIAAELLPQLFELFFQAPRDGDSGRGGGLG
ncbi:MAG TPA: ATP-binding protein, partial [Polyangiales bacterium]|nr:ATP-binding protein [Polyangiales bacterium]